MVVPKPETTIFLIILIVFTIVFVGVLSWRDRQKNRDKEMRVLKAKIEQLEKDKTSKT